MTSPHFAIIHTDPAQLTRKDLVPDTEVRWCPGCADYSILAQVQKTLPTLGIPKENFVFVSGIGCSSRFPYYMDTYGIHGIHGRAPAIATGLKVARPELSIWMITGDGDALAIGGNQLIHMLRRNVGVKVLLFNNRIYGLTKGQYSPTSEMGKKTKSTPMGSIDYPLEPVSVALGVGTTFIARAVATDATMVADVLTRAAKHEGTAFVEFYQSCVIFNDGAFDYLTDAKNKEDHRLVLHHGEPLLFGVGGKKGIGLDAAGHPTIIDVEMSGTSGVLVYDETSDTLPFLLSRLGPPNFPTPLGVFRSVQHPTYESMLVAQIAEARVRKSGNAQSLLNEGESWTVA